MSEVDKIVPQIQQKCPVIRCNKFKAKGLEQTKEIPGNQISVTLSLQEV